MKILHLFQNVRAFIKDCPFYPYFFQSQPFETVICDFLKTGETAPDLSVSVPLKIAFDPYEIQKSIDQTQPDILHCHHLDLLQMLPEQKGNFPCPLIFSVYRQYAHLIYPVLKSNPEIFERVRLILVPNRNIAEAVTCFESPSKVQILEEALETHFQFKLKETKETASSSMTFGVFISTANQDQIDILFTCMEKILLAGRTFHLAWICLDEKVKKKIREKSSEPLFKDTVSVLDLSDFPLLYYDGLITDGNRTQAFSDNQYFHLLISCMKEGKLLITPQNPGLEDILVDKHTCLVLPDQDLNHLSHILHFFVSFPEESKRLCQRAKDFFRSNYSLPIIKEKWKEMILGLGTRKESKS